MAIELLKTGAFTGSNHSKSRKAFRILCYIIVLLAILRLAAPVILEFAINRAIHKAPGIDGQVGAVGLSLYRGAYQINDIEILTVEQAHPEPLLRVKTLELSLLWSALFDGKIAAEIEFQDAEISIFDQTGVEDDEYSGARKESTWTDLLDSIVPLSIDRVGFVKSRVDFTGGSADMAGEAYISDIDGYILNLTGKNIFGKRMTTEASIAANVFGVSALKIDATADVLAPRATFDFDLSIEQVKVENFDKLIKIYAPFDLEAGSIELAMELRSVDGELEGYLETGIHEIDIFSWKEDVEKDGDSPVKVFIEGLAGAIAGLLETDKNRVIATRIPIRGTLDQPDVSAVVAALNLVRNAFLASYDMEVDDILNFKPATKVDENL